MEQEKSDDNGTNILEEEPLAVCPVSGGLVVELA
jgi:hypothetical protein